MEPDRWADINSPHLQAISCRHQCPESPLWEHALWVIAYGFVTTAQKSQKTSTAKNAHFTKCPGLGG